ncbi:MAG TPA: CRTAC1 family protein [Bryobacteraceae bacterium]|jgi:hypothetical protein|nr:CRTAC1 family protein [Bryobacteraceae bacterium]
MKWLFAATLLGAILAAVETGGANTRPQFRNVAMLSRFSYRTRNGYPGHKYFVGSMCGGVAAFDYDGDGNIDLFFTNGSPLPELRKTDPSYFNALLRNRGDGTFDEVTRKAGLEGAKLSYSFGIAVGDYDNDGHPDLFLASAGRDVLYHNNGDGTFSDVTAMSGIDTKPRDIISVAAVWFDYDNDGLLDLAVSEYTTWTPESDIRCFASDGITEVYCSPTRYRSTPNRLYHNLGHGKFEDVTENSGFGKSAGKGMGIVAADFNGDGLMDVFIANDTERNFLYLNRGHGKFEEVGLLYGVAYNENGSTVSGMGADTADYDNDGWPDIFYNDLDAQTFALFHNERGRLFSYVSPRTGIERLSRSFSGWSTHFIDYDNDGWPDIYSANGDVDYLGANAKQHDTMWHNDAGRSFSDVSDRMGPDFLPIGFHRGSARADLNNDGAPDLVITGLNETPRILLNSGSNNHWITLDLTGTRSNRDAIGARLKLVTNSGRTLSTQVGTSSGFMSSSDRRAHFGLGAEIGIREIQIRWPSGTEQIIRHPACDRILHIREDAR